MANIRLGVSSPVAPKIVPTSTQQNQTRPQTPTQTFWQNYITKRSNSAQFDNSYKQQSAQDLAKTVADQSAGYVPTDKFGVVQKPKVDQNPVFEASGQAIQQIGSNATDAAVAANQWQQLKKFQDLQASFNVNPTFKVGYDPTNLPAGSNPNSPGARAVSLAIQAYKNHTPYIWGGNSLTNGVDCSGLVQQVYSKLGIKLPRSSYEQAKAGKVISIGALMPGDMVFYNTGSADPNGIGRYSHVGLYVGNGMIVDAYNTKHGIRYESINGPGNPVLGVRPW